MNMYIYPKYMEDAAKSGWIVKFLKVIGVIQVVGCIAAGLFLGSPFVMLWLEQARVMDSDAATLAAPLISLALSIFIGLFASLTTFALAQVIDDLHALRVQTSAFVAFESDNVHLGK